MRTIRQSDHFRNHFGIVVRSSAIFWVRYSRAFRTTLSLLNYWKLKRDIDVTLVASTRDIQGKLLKREVLSFDRGDVINYRPEPFASGAFTGSVELEAFGSAPLVIPYAAVMAIYESERSVSLVHSYSRVYSSHEEEEGLTLNEGEEACWTVRDDANIHSFGIFHNGSRPCEPQDAELVVRNSLGEERTQAIHLSERKPYETAFIKPRDVMTDLPAFLRGQPGYAALSFRTEGAFTRMLVGNEGPCDFQATHSNFNFKRHATDHVNDREVFMHVPSFAPHQTELVVYPDADSGAYAMHAPSLSEAVRFEGSKGISMSMMNSQTLGVSFEKADGPFPSRLVTALRVRRDGQAVPAECSLGIVHASEPRKRLFWFPVVANKVIGTRIFAVPQSPPFPEGDETELVTMTLFGTTQRGPLAECKVSVGDLNCGVALERPFPNASEMLEGDFGYVTLFAPTAQLVVYVLLERARCVALEHAF